MASETVPTNHLVGVVHIPRYDNLRHPRHLYTNNDTCLFGFAFRPYRRAYTIKQAGLSLLKIYDRNL